MIVLNNEFTRSIINEDEFGECYICGKCKTVLGNNDISEWHDRCPYYNRKFTNTRMPSEIKKDIDAIKFAIRCDEVHSKNKSLRRQRLEELNKELTLSNNFWN